MAHGESRGPQWRAVPLGRADSRTTGRQDSGTLGDFSETNWNDRSVVEIAAEKKADGWFLHAITGEQWLLKLKFRMAKATFNREELISKLAMKPLNELHELPVYGTDRRVKVKTAAWSLAGSRNARAFVGRN